MGRVARAFGSIVNGVLWLQWTFLTRRQVEGSMWMTGRPSRERAFVRRLLAEHPGLADQPAARINAVAERAVGSLGRSRVQAVVIGAMLVAGLIASRGWTLWVMWVGPLRRWSYLAGIAAGVIVVGEVVRRSYIRRDISNAVATVYPTLFCACGYCLMGLPGVAERCPECGNMIAAAGDSRC